jgi:hypothetical protein
MNPPGHTLESSYDGTSSGEMVAAEAPLYAIRRRGRRDDAGPPQDIFLAAARLCCGDDPLGSERLRTSMGNTDALGSRLAQVLPSSTSRSSSFQGVG